MSVIFPHFFFEIFKFLLAQLFIKNKIEKQKLMKMSFPLF